MKPWNRDNSQPSLHCGQMIDEGVGICVTSGMMRIAYKIQSEGLNGPLGNIYVD
jgi:hypothetical protein